MPNVVYSSLLSSIGKVGISVMVKASLPLRVMELIKRLSPPELMI